MIQPYKIPYKLPKDLEVELCGGKLLLKVIDSTPHESIVELAPTKEFTQADFTANVHLKAFFEASDIGVKARTRKPKAVEQVVTPEVKKEVKENKKPKSTEKLKKETKQQESNPVKLPTLKLPSFQIGTKLP